MARKLYIFHPTGRTSQPNAPAKWIGGYSTNYTYLGDYFATMLGAGNHLPKRRRPLWLHTQPTALRHSKGGASRYDPGFRGWG